MAFVLVGRDVEWFSDHISFLMSNMKSSSGRNLIHSSPIPGSVNEAISLKKNMNPSVR